MNIRKMDHIGIVVKDLEQGKRAYGAGIGLTYLREEVSAEFNCRVAFFRCGEVMLELIEPTGPGPSETFLNSRGEGLHHICYEVDDIMDALTTAQANHQTDYMQPKVGAGGCLVFFLHANSMCNVETEFMAPNID